VAMGPIGLSLVASSNFIAQWVPTWLILGLYNKVVKTEGHDHLNKQPSMSH
jgi:hypothetical protein